MEDQTVLKCITQELFSNKGQPHWCYTFRTHCASKNKEREILLFYYILIMSVGTLG